MAQSGKTPEPGVDPERTSTPPSQPIAKTKRDLAANGGPALDETLPASPEDREAQPVALKKRKISSRPPAKRRSMN